MTNDNENEDENKNENENENENEKDTKNLWTITKYNIFNLY